MFGKNLVEGCEEVSEFRKLRIPLLPRPQFIEGLSEHPFPQCRFRKNSHDIVVALFGFLVGSQIDESTHRRSINLIANVEPNHRRDQMSSLPQPMFVCSG